MRILLTGGSGDLGSCLGQQIKAQGDHPVIFDMVPPPAVRDDRDCFIQGSIVDREAVKHAMKDIDCVVHIAALHGIHEQWGKTAYDFHDVNVTGSFHVLQAAAEAGIQKLVFISSTSVDEQYGLYGHTKVLNEEMARAYAVRHGMGILTLRPRAFIPPWNKTVYSNFVDWANWFCKGAVHLHDVCQASLKAINFLKNNAPNEPAQPLVIDGVSVYAESDLDTWTDDTPRRVLGADNVKILLDSGIDILRKPKILGSQDAISLIGYKPEYSLENVIEDFKLYGASGPPNPFL